MLGLNISPLQFLAANGIAFAAGVATTIVLRLYGRHMLACGLKAATATAK